jgi:peptidoglycan/LPS O-acetylase OafA/YrhL
MSPPAWRYLLEELAMIALITAVIVTAGLRLALRDGELHGRSRIARRWGELSGSLFALVFTLLAKYSPQGFGGEVFGALLVAGFVFGFPFGVLLWYLLRGRSHIEGSSNNRWRGP